MASTTVDVPYPITPFRCKYDDAFDDLKTNIQDTIRRLHSLRVQLEGEESKAMATFEKLSNISYWYVQGTLIEVGNHIPHSIRYMFRDTNYKGLVCGRIDGKLLVNIGCHKKGDFVQMIILGSMLCVAQHDMLPNYIKLNITHNLVMYRGKTTYCVI